MASGTQKQCDVARLMAELSALKVELLSAQCAMDRVRLQYPLQDIAALGDLPTLKRSIASAEALYRFCSQIETHIHHRDESTR